MGEAKSEFTPEQLDRIEDALEDLEGLEDLSEFDGSPAVRERLEQYQDLLVLSREAMPIEDVPSGLLDSVLAQAREEAVVVKTPAAHAPAGRTGRAGITRWLVPVLGLVGGAAAVLLIVQVGKNMGDAEERSAALARADGVEQSEVAEAEVAAEELRGRQELSEELDDALAIADSEPSQEEKEEQPAAPVPGSAAESGGGEQPAKPALQLGSATKNEPPADTKPNEKGGGYGPKSKEADVPKAGEDDQGLELNKDEVYDLLATADKKRLQGRCGSAESRYKQVLVSGPDPMAKARAHAGLGLCAEFGGDLKGADKFFTQAKASFAGISSWIDTERAKMPAASETKKSKAKPKKQMREPAEADALEDSL